MGRLIIALVLIFLAWLAIRRLIRGPAGGRQAPKDQQFEKTVRCEQCGVHVVQRLAHERDGRYYCSREHLPGS